MIISASHSQAKGFPSAYSVGHLQKGCVETDEPYFPAVSPYLRDVDIRTMQQAEEIMSTLLNDYQKSTICDVRLEDYLIDECQLLPTPPRSPERSDRSSSSSSSDSDGRISIASVHGACSDAGEGALSAAWSNFEMDEAEVAELCPDVATSAEEMETLRAIMFEHDDFIDTLLKDESMLNSVFGGCDTAAPVDDFETGFEDVQEEDVKEVVGPIILPHSTVDPYDSLGPEERQRRELMHDCMWSGTCTTDCKQKDLKKYENGTITPFDDDMAVSSGTSALRPNDVLDMRTAPFATTSPCSGRIAGDTTTETAVPATSPLKAPAVVPVSADDVLVAGPCVDPCAVLSYTPLSDHSYHQATSSAPPTPPDSPKAVSQQSSSSGTSATSRGGGGGSAGVGQLTLYRSQNGHWQRSSMVMSDTPSESGEFRFFVSLSEIV
ncbi:hypothetical protein HPB50_004313 [Hyalomma asiaticum]|uniref:Uncharacterized protein n=1 Tax=Hyalomma asiaticum TaxID=266040 RepID=A0ACB7RHS4_HYAAI|nr:hypothetical protein HPB50_004313 [Hyalomma asiaticum]